MEFFGVVNIEAIRPCFANPFTIVPGAHVYDNVSIAGYRNDFDLAAQVWNIAGDLTMGTRSGNRTFNNGEIWLGGNLTKTSDSGYGGTGKIVLTGNPSGQTITGTGTGPFASSLEIDTGVQNVTLVGDIHVRTAFDVVGVGTLTTAGSQITFHCPTSSLSCFASDFQFGHAGYTFDSLYINGYQTGMNLFASTLTLTGNLTMRDFSGVGSVRNGTILVGGDYVLQSNKPGDVNITLNGSAGQNLDLRGASPPSGTLTISKPGGSVVTLISDAFFSSTGQNFDIVSGDVNMNGHALSVDSILTIGAGSTLTQNGGALSYGTLVNNGTLN